ncbi:MAG: hypothetical protein ACQGVC_21765 [Myxococcota bacterium]
MARPRRLLLPVLLAWLAIGCASRLPAPPPPPEWNASRRAAAERLQAELREAPPAGDALVVRLAFAPGVDLDLYVTDPRLETVYYANTPSVSGGELVADRRCDTPGDATRVETVRFAAPPAGRYRIGVDFPHRCEGGPDEVPYAIQVDDRGVRSERSGLARWLEFTVIVHEFEVADGE